MKLLMAATVALAVLALAAPAQAQGPNPQGLSFVSTTSAGDVPYEGGGEFGFTLSVGCADVLQGALTGGAASATVTVGLTNAPAWLNFTPVEVAVAPGATCAETGQVQVSDTLSFTVSTTAPAVAQQTVNLRATLGETVSATDPAVTYTVAYNSVFSLTPAVQFPMEVTNKTTTFDVTGVQASNAPSMIMVDDFSCADGALISGIGALQYANKAGQADTKTYKVTFTAPSKDWEKATCSLTYYGHFNFDGMAGEPIGRQTVKWEFSNGGVKAEDTGEKESPAPVFAFVGLGLLAFAGLRRRQA